MNKLTNTFEGFAIESFRKVVSTLALSVNFVDLDSAITHITPKEVPLHKEILRSVGDALFGGEKKSAVVVFKH